jgi:hypothetical protein
MSGFYHLFNDSRDPKHIEKLSNDFRSFFQRNPFMKVLKRGGPPKKLAKTAPRREVEISSIVIILA